MSISADFFTQRQRSVPVSFRQQAPKVFYGQIRLLPASMWHSYHLQW